MKGNIKKGDIVFRDLSLDMSRIDDAERTVPASLSSEIEVEQRFGREVLVHDKSSVNLERASEGLPLLFSHDKNEPIGIVENVRIDGGKLRGVLRFSQNSKASEVWADVRDGFMRNVSIGYRVHKWDDADENNVVRVTKWTPYEASVVSVPADSTVGINRNEEIVMTTDTTDGNSPAESKEGLNVVDFTQAREQAKEEGRQEANANLLKRIDDINGIFVKHRGGAYDDLRDECIRSGVTVDLARKALLDYLSEGTAPISTTQEQVEGSAWGRDVNKIEHISSGQDSIDKYREGVEKALLVRSSLITDREDIREARQNEYFSMAPSEMAREYLRIANVSVKGFNRDKVVGTALATRGIIGHSTSDFAQVLENVASKALLIGYDEAPETWQEWCRVGSLPDFRQGSRVNVSAFGDLGIVYEDGEYKYGTVSDHKETLQLATYGKLFSISRQALINDDLSALSTVPRGMGRAAARQVGDLAYAVLTANAVLNQDATALFDLATHDNYLAGGTGTAVSVASVNVARTKMALQTDPSGAAVLNISPSYMIGPKALEGTMRALAAAEYDPAGTAGTLTPNTVRGTFQVITDARLDQNDPAEWYMAANPNQFDTIEVAFLDGQQSPYMESQDGWSTDGVSYKVRIDAVAGAMDFRGLYRNNGN